MPTFMHALLVSLDDRWREVDVLLDRAQADERNFNLEFHDVLCRASVVLIAAHLEGFIRDCAKALVADINRFSTFRQSPARIKRIFCRSFITAEDARSNARVEKLIQTFDSLETKLTPDPFLFEGKNDDHKNASPSVIQRISKNFGVDKIFTFFAGSKLDIVFGGSASEVAIVTTDLRDHLIAGVKNFPYAVDAAKFDLDVPSPATSGTRTLWETFLDNLMEQRHMIAHGASQLNGSSVSEIRDAKGKVIVLQYGVMLVLCKSLQ